MSRTILLTIALLALLVPVAALADGTQPSPAAVANQACSQLKTSMGASTFASTYGTNANKSNAFGQCVAKQTRAAAANIDNALKSCKAAQAADPAAFNAKYGTNGKSGSPGAANNALGKCVSAAVKQSTSAQTKSLVAAAKSCKAALKASATDFATKWGSKSNAFGKCVAATAKTK
jgi:hypothetical protein